MKQDFYEDYQFICQITYIIQLIWSEEQISYTPSSLDIEQILQMRDKIGLKK